MKSEILETIGIDPAIILIAMAAVMLIELLLILSVTLKYNRLKKNYVSFMRGKNGETLEDSILEKFSDVKSIAEMADKNRQDIRELNKKMETNYQKAGIVKYDAFNEMGGKLSFAVTLLDGNNNGFIINSMHSREGCYNYTKEIVNGQSYIELSEEESESLEKAIEQSLGLQ